MHTMFNHPSKHIPHTSLKLFVVMMFILMFKPSDHVDRLVDESFVLS